MASRAALHKLFNTLMLFMLVSCSSNKRSHPFIYLGVHLLKTLRAVGESPNLKSPILQNSQFGKYIAHQIFPLYGMWNLSNTDTIGP